MHDFLDIALELTEAACAAVLEVYNSADFNVELKGDSSPVTRADLESSALLVQGLSQRTSLPVLSEESPVETATRLQWKSFWLVDPLDGTKDFIARDDEFTVNVALIEDHEPVLGVVAAPALNLLYFGVRGHGAYRVEAGSRTRIFAQSNRTELVCADSRFHASSETEIFCRQNRIATLLRFGSSVKFCKLAEGEIDVYPRFGPTMEWDIAAAHIVAKEAGCQVLEMKSRSELRYNKADLRNGAFIAAVDPSRFKW